MSWYDEDDRRYRYRDEDFRERRAERRKWNDRSMWKERDDAGLYTGGWNTQGFGGWSPETGYERHGFGGPWSYGRTYGTESLYGPPYPTSAWSEQYPFPNDTRTEGRYRGQGPKGWRRADERIADEVNETLARHSWLDASDIEAEVKDAEVTLTGTVASKEQKRLARDLVEEILGVEDVHNKLKVEKRHDHEHHDHPPAVAGHESTVARVIKPN